MRLLGHHNANMTLIYVEVSQQDLQRQYQAALERPRYLVPPPPRVAAVADASLALSLERVLTAALSLFDQQCTGRPSSPDSQPFVRLRRRLLRIQAALRKLLPHDQAEK